MNIVPIAHPLRSYSQKPGSHCLLPHSFYLLEIFPALIIIKRAERFPFSPIATLQFSPIKERLHEFAIYQDLEKEYVEVCGKGKSHFFRYRLISLPKERGILVHFDRLSSSWILSFSSSFFCPFAMEQDHCLPHSSSIQVEKKQKISLLPQKADQTTKKLPPLPKQKRAKLSFGQHKKLDWHKLWQRLSLKELLPIWFTLADLLPPLPPQKIDEKKGGLFSLFFQLCSFVELEQKEKAEELWLFFLRVAFDSMLVPHSTDEHHWGVDCPPLQSDCTPLHFLSWGRGLILSCLCREQEETLSLLPLCLSSFACGKLLSYQWQHYGMLDMEWRQKKIRRIRFFSFRKGKVSFLFPKSCKSYRLRTSVREKGERMTCGLPLSVEKERLYFFDRFYC